MATILPAILTGDLAVARGQIAEAAGWTGRIHVDIADGTFVAAKTISIEGILGLAPRVSIEFHLMVTDPARLLAAALSRQADCAIVHHSQMQDQDLPRRGRGRLTLAVDLSDDIARLTTDHNLLAMAIQPGAQGTPYQAETVERVRQLRARFPMARIGVDGSMNRETIPALAAAGADYFVVGSAIWRAAEPAAAFQQLQNCC